VGLDAGTGGPRVLVVEDDPYVRMAVAHVLRREGMRVFEAVDGDGALAALAADPPDAVVLDWMMPGVDGLEVLRRLRRHSGVPVLMLTAMGKDDDKVAGFEQGADDYLVKPFSTRELVARVKALLRRGATAGAAGAAVVVGGLTLDVARRVVRVDGHEASLTPAEFNLLALLATRPGETFTARELLRAARGYEADEREAMAVVRMLVFRLRRKIELDPASPTHLVAVRGGGYALC
jgi:DNA-binding response OmpR family regulator